jgi:hypothetical protein
MMLTPHSTTPDANIIFFPFKREDTIPFITGKQPKSQRMDINQISAQHDIITLQTSKPKGGMGSWNCMLSSRVNWKRILHPGCWCLIYISTDLLSGNETSELDSGLKMIGIVKSVRRLEDLDPSTGTRRVRFSVSGDDFHSVFNTPIYLNVNLSDAVQGHDVSIANALLVLNKAFGVPLSPSGMVKALVDSLLGRPGFTADKSGTNVNRLAFFSRGGQPYLIPQVLVKRILGFNKIIEKETFFTRMVTFFLQNDLIGKIALQSDLGQMVTAWSLIHTYCHTILNEVYTDLLPTKITTTARLTPSLVLRAIPFTSPSGKKAIKHSSLITMQDAGGPVIPTRKAGLTRISGKSFTPSGKSANFYISRSIGEDEIFSFSSGKSDGERFNFFFVPPNITGYGGREINEAAFVSKILFGKGFDQIGDTASIARYGLRPYFGFSDYMLSDDSKIGLINQIVKDMYQQAHLFENGQITIIGTKEHIPVGTNIEWISRGWIAHVEKVDHVFEVGMNGMRSYRTTIAFSRLQNKKDGSPVDAVENTNISQAGEQFDFWDRGASST